jgi:hypothetical protein
MMRRSGVRCTPTVVVAAPTAIDADVTGSTAGSIGSFTLPTPVEVVAVHDGPTLRSFDLRW